MMVVYFIWDFYLCISSQVRCSSLSTLGESLTSLEVITRRMTSCLLSSSWAFTLWEGKRQTVYFLQVYSVSVNQM